MENSDVITHKMQEVSLNKKHEWFRLTKGRAVILLIYLLTITILSFASLCILVIAEINPFLSLSLFSISIISSIMSALLGSSIYYSRKLYKACINQDMIEPIGKTDTIRQLGITVYYFSRPLYSACLSLIVCIALKSGTEFISTNGILNDKFQFLIIIISFFVGYSSSDFIDDLEIKGRKIVNGIIKADK